MTARLVSLMALGWMLGFAAFMLLLPPPLAGQRTDAIVVPTGAAGRIDRGLDVLQSRAASRMLITGTAPEVRPAELAAEYHRSPALFACCIDLGHEAVDTRSNAEETAAWVRRHRCRSVRLVTSDWHAPRARMELVSALDGDASVICDGVQSNPRIGLLVAEYNKLLLRRVALWFGLGA